MKKNVKLGSYIVEKENGYVKISHENKSWNIRLGSTPEATEKFFEDCKEDDWRKYFEVAFAGTQTFSILAIQNPMYVEAWIKWHNEYFAGLNKEVSEEDDATIIAEEKALYEMKETAESAQQADEKAEIITESTKKEATVETNKTAE